MTQPRRWLRWIGKIPRRPKVSALMVQINTRIGGETPTVRSAHVQVQRTDDVHLGDCRITVGEWPNVTLRFEDRAHVADVVSRLATELRVHQPIVAAAMSLFVRYCRVDPVQAVQEIRALAADIAEADEHAADLYRQLADMLVEAEDVHAAAVESLAALQPVGV